MAGAIPCEAKGRRRRAAAVRGMHSNRHTQQRDPSNAGRRRDDFVHRADGARSSLIRILHEYDLPVSSSLLHHPGDTRTQYAVTRSEYARR